MTPRQFSGFLAAWERREERQEFRHALAPYVFAQANSKERLRIEEFMPSRMGRPRRRTGQELIAAFVAAGAKVVPRGEHVED